MSRRPETPKQKAAAAGAIAVALVIIGRAQVDLHNRPESAIRGNKRLWQLACLNALGALAYFRWGRRAP